MTLALRDPRVLDDLLNYRLMRLYALSGAPVVRLLEGRYGITRREWRLLATLGAHGPASPSALAEGCDLDRPRTSRAIGSMATKGLVKRLARPGDARRALVSLTASGETMYRAIFGEVAHLNARLVATLDEATIRTLDAALSRLTEAARRQNQQAVRDASADRHAGSARRIRR